jgi:hypothetical protein
MKLFHGRKPTGDRVLDKNLFFIYSFLLIVISNKNQIKIKIKMYELYFWVDVGGTL